MKNEIISKSGDDYIKIEDFVINKYLFIIKLIENNDIIIECINTTNYSKFYQVKLAYFQLSFQFNNNNPNEIYEKILSSLKQAIIKEDEFNNELEITILLNGKFNILMSEKRENSHIMQIIQKNNEKEKCDLIKENNNNKIIINEKNDLINELNKVKKEKDDLGKNYDDLSAINAKLYQDNEELNYNNEILKKNSQDLNNKYDQLLKENEELMNNNEILKKNSQDLNNKYNQLLKENEELKKKLKNEINNQFFINMDSISSHGTFIDTLNSTTEDNNLKILDLSYRNEGNQLLENLTIRKFDNLEELKLSTNGITDINLLGKMKLEKLKSLHLYYNFIKDLTPLTTINLDQLKKLYLNNNNISDITPLKNVNCLNLEDLNLHNNHINDITPLSEVKFKNLVKLTLHKNNIRDISILKFVKFENLKKLSLYENKIRDISVFNKVNFPKLDTLWLYKNDFSYDKNNSIIQSLKGSISNFL